MKQIPILISIALSATGAWAQAQILTNADIASAQPIIGRDSAGFNQCGFRAMVGILKGDKNIEMFDFSVQLTNFYAGLMKAGKYIANPNNSDLATFQRGLIQPPPKNFWIGPAGSAHVATATKNIPSESKGFSLFLTDFSAASETVGAAIEGRRLQFAMRYANEKVDRIVAFKVDLSQGDKDDFWSCMKGLQSRLEADATPTP